MAETPTWGQGDFWIDTNGVNLLGGVECPDLDCDHRWNQVPCDPAYPVLLPDCYILDFLITIPDARASFDRLLPQMTAAEQVRLNRIALMASNGYVLDPVFDGDRFQHGLNTANVIRGGGWLSPTWVNGQ